VLLIRWNPSLSSKAKLGLFLFSVGLFKKLVFADSIAPMVNQIPDPFEWAFKEVQTGPRIG